MNLLQEMVKSLDAFSGQQSRLIVVVDGLDSVEQRKVLSVLDTVHTLFSDPGSPFIIVSILEEFFMFKPSCRCWPSTLTSSSRRSS